MRFEPYALILLISALVSAVVGVLSWKRRAVAPAAAALALIMLASVEWAGIAAIGLTLGGPVGARLCVLGIYPGVAGGVMGFFWFCQAMAGRGALPPRRVVLLLAVEPVLVTLAALTNGRHGWLITSLLSSEGTGLPSARFGPLFYVHGAYSYVLLGWGFGVLALAWRTASDLHRRQLRTMLLSAMVVVLFNVFSLVYVGRSGGPDLTATSFVVTGLIMWWGLFRQGIVQLVPVARAVVLERLSDAVIVIDVDGRILDYNPAALRLARRTMPGLPADLVGRRLRSLVIDRKGPASAPLERALYERASERHAFEHGPDEDGPDEHGPDEHAPDHPGVAVSDALVVPRSEMHGEYRLQAGDDQVDLDVRTGRLTDRRGAVTGHVIVARDISELSERKRELTRANRRLEEQLATIERLRADLAEQAIRDVLTGLHNRRHLLEMFDAEVRRALATGEPLGVVLLDIDRFKMVNDRFGHAVGDDLLVAMAQSLAGLARTGDTVARYGGEEFVVLLPGTTMGQAWERADEWRKVCATIFVGSRQGPVSTTLSAGVATFPECGATPAALLQAADEALYAAKAAGRDLVLPARPSA